MKPNFKPNKRIFLWIGGILLFLLILNFGINLWIKAKVPAIIQERNDTAYNFDYEKISFSLLSNSLAVEGISITPKTNFKEKAPIDFTAKVEEIKVVGVNFFKLLKNKDLSALSIKINSPDVTYYKPIEKDTTQSKSKLGSVIQVSNFQINDAYFKMFDTDRKTKISDIKNLDFELGGVNLSQRTLEKNIPFTYSTFELSCGDVFFQLNPSQELISSSFKVNNNLFILNGFQISSPDSLAITEHHNLNYRLLPRIKAPTVTFTGLDWGFDKKDDLYFNAMTLKFDSVDVNIQTSSERPSEKEKNYGQLIPFKIDIGKIQIDNSKLRVRKRLIAKNINILIEKIKNEIGGKLIIENVLVNHPEIISFTGREKKAQKKTKHTVFSDIIQIKNLEIKDGLYKLNKVRTRENMLTVKDFNFKMEDIEMNPETYYEQIPIIYKSVKVSATSLDYNPDKVYSLKSNNILFDNGDFSLDKFEMKPKISRSQFVKQLKKEKDLYTITAKKIKINDLDFGFQGKDMFFKIPDMDLETVYANIYRSKIPPDDPKKKLMYSKMLRDLPIILEVKNIDLKNSQVEYEEETTESTGAGKLTFSNFNANIKNVYSGFKKSTVPDVRADITTHFMKDSKLTAVWTFNPMNRSEKFNIKGNIYNFDAQKMTPFIKPYLHVTAEGNMREVRFNFTGNDINATGDFGVKYDNLKVTVYNKDTGKVRKVVSTLGNFLVRSNTKDQYKEERIETVTRNQDRSFFNFFWNCVQQGLKQTVLVI